MKFLGTVEDSRREHHWQTDITGGKWKKSFQCANPNPTPDCDWRRTAREVTGDGIPRDAGYVPKENTNERGSVAGGAGADMTKM